MSQAPPAPVMGPDDEDIPLAAGLECRPQMEARLGVAGLLVGVDAVAPGLLEGFELQFRALVDNGDSSVADDHRDKDHLDTRARRCCSEP